MGCSNGTCKPHEARFSSFHARRHEEDAGKRVVPTMFALCNVASPSHALIEQGR